MSFAHPIRVKRSVALGAAALILLFVIACSLRVKPEAPAKGLYSDPILTLGHGSFINQQGEAFTPDTDFMVGLQAYYIETLQARLPGKDKAVAKARQMQAEAYRLVEDPVLAGALVLDWLLERSAGEDTAQMTMVNHALRWFYLLNIQKNPDLPKDGQKWSKGIRPEIAARLESLGFVVFLATNDGGAAYRSSCSKQGVPVPARVMSSDWTNRGTFDREFISEGSVAELWLFESSDPPGVCLALPRYVVKDGEVTNDIGLLGVICLGTQSNKACFFDNPRGKLFRRGDQPSLSEFVGGADLVANGQGTCTDCHAGENPYIVHPEKAPFAGLTDTLRPQGWHDPLVVANWPQNPGPTNLLDAVPSTQSCAGCHTQSFAGRFPEVSNQLGGYCFIVATATGAPPKRTMPMGGGNIANFQPHIAALTQACNGAPSGGGVVVDADYTDNASYLSPPLLYVPIYQCATTVTVRGAVLDAKVDLFVNGNLVASQSPARDPDKIEFTGLAELKASDVVTARQSAGPATSALSPAVTVRDHAVDFPGGLPAPTIDPTLVHECSSVIAIRHVPSAKVTVLVNGGMPVSFVGSGSGWTAITPGKQPFVVGDVFTATAGLCSDVSPSSAPVWAVAAPSSIPVAKFEPTSTFNGQELVLTENLTNGSKSTVSELVLGQVGSFSTPISWKPNYDVATRIGRPLNASDRLTIGQELCAVTSTSEPTSVLPCEDLPAPKVGHPLVGQTFVIVTESIPGARVRVYDATDDELGDGSGTVIQLKRAITGADTLTVVQQVGDCMGKRGYLVSVRNPGSTKPK